MPAKYYNAILDYPQTIWMHTILQHLACRAFAKRGCCSIPPKTRMRLAPNASQRWMVFDSTKNPNAASAQCQPSTIMLFPTTHKLYRCIQNYRIWLAEPLQNRWMAFNSTKNPNAASAQCQPSTTMPFPTTHKLGGWCSIPLKPQMQLAPLAASLNNPLTKNGQDLSDAYLSTTLSSATTPI
ncbi:uncharacterized protein BDR25DRAFT_360174 [Lindgomyces ingoldianus]|uniref:Uncharacterized protein n=1 Tax=Lindgomyces ingoldianus TaxID=673940 RepID=A0ACB6QHQ2_9PLEO|nr:uncharacterized protein BDR25DRAFT_360174 [Lindgomyces ingoldianus]KAF2465665.1 hypothetical protein BDR25DRAFT_360174 [Lindgomyces ingoldianus]